MFYSIPNLSANVATPMEKPWECTLQAPIHEDKADHRKWSISLATKHAFISAVEGMTATVRVSTEQGNVPHKLHALIVDFDATVDDAMFAKLLIKPAVEFLPAWGVSTYSGNARLVWMFEKPINIVSAKQYKAFMASVNKKLKLNSWLPGLDTGALSSPAEYYEIGRRWIPLKTDAFIPSNFLEKWLYDVSSHMSLDEGAPTYTIPMEVLAAEAEAKFPGRWKGPFEEGRRGVRFWDPDASDETGCVIMKEGCMAFSGEQSFVPWRMIFGSNFVEKFQADKIGPIRERAAFDSKEFWLDDGPELGWRSYARPDFSQFLRGQGFSGKVAKGATASEVDMAELDIKRGRRVKKAFPFIHYPRGIITFEGEPYLNIASATCIPPAKDLDIKTPEDAIKHFPFIWALLRSLFVNVNPLVDEDPTLQLKYFLAWLKRAYVNGLAQSPVQGHAIIILGDTGVGKTLLVNRVVGPLLGGYSDASSYFTSADGDWTDRLLQKPVMLVDDSSPLTDHGALMRFSASIKKIVANARIVYNEKYKQAGEVCWFGRVIVLANLDSNSQQMIPNMDMSNKDKIMLFKVVGKPLVFKDAAENNAKIASELSAFGQFLCQWTPPAEIVTGAIRFGVRAYHHPELLEESSHSGIAGVVHEALDTFLREYKLGHKNESYWEGNAATLYELLCVGHPAAMRGITINSFRTALGIMHGKDMFGLEKLRAVVGKSRATNRYWRVYFDFDVPMSAREKKEEGGAK